MKTIAIVGRPNVGKSRLFNRIIRRRHSIVEDTPGVTRDRVEFISESDNERVRWIDTGGIGLSDNYAEAVTLQAQVAIEAADAVIFVVDARTGFIPADEEIAKKIRGKASVIVAMNKADEERLEQNRHDFARLGLGEVLPVSAEHGRGIEALVETALALCADAVDEEELATVTKLAIVGRPNVGKSSLLNAILGHERVIVSERAGTTRDAIEVEVNLPAGKIVIIDTAGIRKKRTSFNLLESVMVGRAKKAVERSDVSIVVVDAVDGFADQDHKILSAVLAMGRGAVIALNKWDAVEKKEFDAVVKKIRHKLGTQSHVPIVSVSALKKIRVQRLLEVALSVGRNAMTRMKTGDLNRLLGDVAMRAPAGVRIKYAIQTSVMPPTFLIFGSRKPPKSVENFLRNSIRANGTFEGVPIVMEFRA